MNIPAYPCAHKLPPLESVILTVTPFNTANSDVLHLIISGLSRKYISITQNEEIQGFTENYVEILSRYGSSTILLSPVNILLRYGFGSYPVYREELYPAKKQSF